MNRTRGVPIEIGQTYGSWVVVGAPTPNEYRVLTVLAQCRTCGTTAQKPKYRLLAKSPPTCRCEIAEQRRKTIPTGTKIGRWLVTGSVEAQSGNSMAQVRCECGTESVIAAAALRAGSTKSCGCAARESLARRATKHGLLNSPLHRVWSNMLQRCSNPNWPSYHRYGGRGITVCDEWRAFQKFYDDMSPTYSPGLWLDRIDNDGAYAAANCRWVTPREQANNRENTVLLDTCRGRMPVSEVARIAGVNNKTIRTRVKNGWRGERLFLPAQR